MAGTLIVDPLFLYPHRIRARMNSGLIRERSFAYCLRMTQGIQPLITLKTLKIFSFYTLRHSEWLAKGLTRSVVGTGVVTHYHPRGKTNKKFLPPNTLYSKVEYSNAGTSNAGTDLRLDLNKALYNHLFFASFNPQISLAKTTFTLYTKRGRTYVLHIKA